MSDLSTSERQRILGITTQLLEANPCERTSFSMLAARAGIGEQRLRREFGNWPQVALAAFVDRVTKGCGQTRTGSLPESPLERVLAAAEELVRAADAQSALLFTAMQGPSTDVWRDLSDLFGARGPFSGVGDDLELAAATGELPAGTARAAQDVIVSSVLGLVLNEAAGSERCAQSSWELMQGSLLFGLSHLAGLRQQR